MAIGLDALREGFPGLRFDAPADGVLELVIANEGSQNSATEVDASRSRERVAGDRRRRRKFAPCWCAVPASISHRAAISN